jgi:ankyrin repeat protein
MGGEIDFAVIKNLLVLAREALEIQNHAGDTPLHLLLASDAFRQRNLLSTTDNIAVAVNAEAATLEAIVSILHMARDLVRQPNLAGLTPLHVAIANQCYESVVRHLIAVGGKSAATLADHNGMVPLHYVAAFGGAASMAHDLISCCPDSICCQTIYGDTPLHLLISNAKASSAHGSAETQEDAGIFLSEDTAQLAQLCIGSGSEEISPLLVQNLDGMTPLHCCAVFQSPASLTRILMDPIHSGYFGRIASVLLAKDGSTALHLALAALTPSSSKTNRDNRDDSWYRNADANALALLTPEACAILDAKERTPLMLAVQSDKPSLVLVKALIASLPKSARIADSSKGYLPIHLACQNRNIKVQILKGT